MSFALADFEAEDEYNESYLDSDRYFDYLIERNQLENEYELGNVVEISALVEDDNDDAVAGINVIWYFDEIQSV